MERYNEAEPHPRHSSFCASGICRAVTIHFGQEMLWNNKGAEWEEADLEDRVDIHTDNGELCTSVGQRPRDVCSGRLQHSHNHVHD